MPLPPEQIAAGSQAVEAPNEEQSVADPAGRQQWLLALHSAVLVEEQFGVSIPDEEIGKSAFASIDALADFIREHQAASA